MNEQAYHQRMLEHTPEIKQYLSLVVLAYGGEFLWDELMTGKHTFLNDASWTGGLGQWLTQQGYVAETRANSMGMSMYITDAGREWLNEHSGT